MRAGAAGLRASESQCDLRSRAALPPCRPRSVGRGAALPWRPAHRGMLAGGRRRSARAIVTRSAETGPGLREGLQPRVERGRPGPARPRLRTSIALGQSTAIARTSTYSPRRCSCAPGVPRVRGMTEGKPSCPITGSYRASVFPIVHAALSFPLLRCSFAGRPATRPMRCVSPAGTLAECCARGRKRAGQRARPQVKLALI